MTQDERWMARYNEVKAFIEGNKRRPSKYAPEERNAWNWLRHMANSFSFEGLEVYQAARVCW